MPLYSGSRALAHGEANTNMMQFIGSGENDEVIGNQPANFLRLDVQEFVSFPQPLLLRESFV